MNYIMLTNGHLLSEQRIAELREIYRPGKATAYIAVDVSGHVHDTLDVSYEDFLVRSAPVIPAFPGFYVFRWTHAGEIWKVGPVVGWAVGTQICSPILVDDGIISPSADYAVVSPDGRIEVPFHAAYESEEKFREFVAEECKGWAARVAWEKEAASSK